jgi:hypothetical protein
VADEIEGAHAGASWRRPGTPSAPARLQTGNQILISWFVVEVDYELEVLLSLDGLEFQFACGYRIMIAVQRVEATRSRPQEIKYSLTLQNPRAGGSTGATMPTACGAGSPSSITGIISTAGGGWSLCLSGTGAAARGFLRRGGANFARARCNMKRKAGTFQEFKGYTLAVARGERAVDPSEPKVWCEPTEGGAPAEREVQFASFEAGAKLLSAKNRVLLRAIAERQPKSVAELAAMTARAEQNVLRTLKKLETAGVVRLKKAKAAPAGQSSPPARFTLKSICSARVSVREAESLRCIFPSIGERRFKRGGPRR